MKSILMILGLASSLSLTFSARNGNRLKFRYENTYVNFQLNIEVFDPKGLKVSIPHKDGLEIFSFHGNVNSPFSDPREDRDSSSFAHDVTGSINGQWVYENKDIKLRIGDVLNYWVFLQYKGAGERFNDLSYTVKKLTSNSSSSHSGSYSSSSSSISTAYHTTRSPILSAFRPPTTTPPPILYSNPMATNYDHPIVRPNPMATNYAHQIAPTNYAHQSATTIEKQCECNEDSFRNVWAQMNATVVKMRALEEIINPLEEKLNSLTETVVELIKNMDVGTKLLLTGNLPVRTNPVEDVRHLIVEKLKLFDLSTTILQAEYKHNGISFEVSSSVDKLRILKRSSDILSKLSYQIIDPDRPAFDVRMARK